MGRDRGRGEAEEVGERENLQAESPLSPDPNHSGLGLVPGP